ncbi:hypothetical protein EC973_005263 [Apophysomyces ossiformis]|uniref:MACPF domain-containing protein n=1 Tax=Apophysomyces ossiformis TaxID=679940 RepID=A0A8H7EUL2_9FUNG|nr:hypothetical protein EC973_005263 [Apophysomyces ossiformis]
MSQDGTEEWRKCLLFNGQLAPEEAIKPIDEEDYTKLLTRSNRMEYIDEIKVSTTELVNYQSFDADFRLNLLPEIAMFKAGANIGFRRTRCNSSASRSEIHRSVLYLSCAELSLSRALVEPTASFKTDVEKALQETSNNKQRQALQEVFKRYGFLYASKIFIGGRITYDHVKATTSEERSKNNHGNAGFFAGAENVGASSRISRTALKSKILNYLQQNKHVEIIGGGLSQVINLESDVDKWLESIKENPKIIRYTDIQPIYNLLGENQRQRIKTLYEDASNVDTVRYNHPLNMKHRTHLGPFSLEEAGPINHLGRVLLASKPLTARPVSIELIRKASRYYPEDPYIRYGDVISIRVTGEESHGFLHTVPTKIKRKLGGTDYIMTSVYPSQDSHNLQREWIIESADRQERDLDDHASMTTKDFVRNDDVVFLRSRLNEQYFLCLASSSFRIWKKRRHVAAKLRFATDDEEARWTFSL